MSEIVVLVMLILTLENGVLTHKTNNATFQTMEECRTAGREEGQKKKAEDPGATVAFNCVVVKEKNQAEKPEEKPPAVKKPIGQQA